MIRISIRTSSANSTYIGMAPLSSETREMSVEKRSDWPTTE
jgi:hypothetical protein